MAKLTLNNVHKVFGSATPVVAVEDVSIDIDDGEFLVLVGPSGCGKSTTLRMIAGLETVTHGEITLDDRVLNDCSPTERDIAMVFQSYALYPHMTVRGNMRFGLEESTSLLDDEIDELVSDTAQLLDIEELLDRKPGELSGGQQQRVALGRAIVRDPAVFLMDEPLSNLDAKLRSQMRTELQRLQEDLGVTTVYVTHDQTEAMTMGDRIAILNDGRLQQVGTPLECYHQPANRFVAGFIGEPAMNFFEMNVQGSELISSDSYDMSYPLSAALREDIGETDNVTLGVRPEDIELVSETNGPSDFPAVVDVIEPMGNQNNVYLAFDEAADNPQTFIATVGGFERIDQDQSVAVHIPEDAIHVFDGATGEVLRNRELETIDETKPTA